MRFLYLLLIFWITFPSLLLAQSTEDSIYGDFEALIDIYNTMNGENWYNQDGWTDMTPETMGDAWGVTTDRNGRVTHLDFQTGIPYSNPSATNADDLGNGLTNAELVGGEYVLIEGREFPESIGNLKKLVYINLKQNNIRGPIPKNIVDLENVERLLLSGHVREPEPGSQNHPRSGGDSGKETYAANFWEGTIPEKIDLLQNLEVFEAQQCGLFGSLPSEFASIPNLRMILLNSQAGEGLSGPLPPELGNASQLQNLHIHGNSFTGTIPPEWGGMVELRSLRISGNQLEGEIPRELSSMSKLRWFMIGNNNFTGEPPFFILESLEDKSSFDYFRIRHNNFEGELPDIDGTPFTGITIFNFNGNNIYGSIPPGFANFRTIQANWSDNNLTGELPKEFSNPNAPFYERLRYWRLQRNNLTGQLPDVNFPSGPRGPLRFDGNNFTGSIPASWGNIPDGGYPLIILLDGNSLSGKIPTELANISNLDVLDISNNKFTEEDIEPLLLILSSSVDFKYSNQNPDDSNSSDEDNTKEEETNDSEDGNDERDQEVLEAPSQLSPSDHAENVALNLTLEWTDIGADEYILHIDRDGDSQFFYSDHEGVTITNNSYTFSSETLPERRHTWRVRGVIGGEKGEWSSVWEFTTQKESDADKVNNDNEKEKSNSEIEIQLDQNYPNPFNPTTQIRFSVPETQRVSLKIYDMSGRLVATLVDGMMPSGNHQRTFNAEGLASGVYFYRFVTRSEVITRKMTLMK